MRGAERNRSRRWSGRADEDVVRSIDDIVGVLLDVDIPAVLCRSHSSLLKQEQADVGDWVFFLELEMGSTSIPRIYGS
jgi:hypothetical protein